MKTFAKTCIIITGLALNSTSWALPILQLDIVGGLHDPVTATTVAQSPVFTLRALLSGSLNANAPYYISMAVIGRNGSTFPSSPAFGPVTVDGTSYDASRFSYGRPFPGIPLHEIFPAYYVALPSFDFASSQTVAAYDVQTDTAASGDLYYVDFLVDATSLLAFNSDGSINHDRYDLHFDLYDGAFRPGIHLAPFSADASSWYGETHNVPDAGATFLLLGLGLAGLAGLRRKISNS